MTNSHIAGCLTAVAICASGCSLFEDVDWTTADSASRRLQPIQPAIDTVQVEIFYAERSKGDPLLGDILWDNVDESGALDHATREIVNQNGIRVGIVGADPPHALQRLLGLTTDETSDDLKGRRVSLLEGTSTEVQTSPDYEVCTVSFIDHERTTHTHDFADARCVFRLKAERFQPGWAKLQFQPEIHYGENRLRHQATDVGWNLRTTQNVKQLFSQRFEVTLNQGEIVIITSTTARDDAVGEHFFNHGQPPTQKQRVLVVRLGEMNTTMGQRSD